MLEGMLETQYRLKQPVPTSNQFIPFLGAWVHAR